MIYGDVRLPSRFWHKVEVSLDGCWLWIGACTPTGYGLWRLAGHGKQVYVHRTIYEVDAGSITNGLTIDHICRVRNCVNPGHLEMVTSRENALRGTSPCAQNARKTHCKNGHLFTEKNTYVKPDGERRCRICNRKPYRVYQ